MSDGTKSLKPVVYFGTVGEQKLKSVSNGSKQWGNLLEAGEEGT